VFSTLNTKIESHATQGNIAGIKRCEETSSRLPLARRCGQIDTTVQPLLLAMGKRGCSRGGYSMLTFMGQARHDDGFAKHSPQVPRRTNFFTPPMAYGVQVMSWPFLTTKDTQFAWRWPNGNRRLDANFWTQTPIGMIWHYLLSELPPGTERTFRLPLAQKVPVAVGYCYYATRDIALLMRVVALGNVQIQSEKIPVLGVVENMSMHKFVSNCGASRSHLWRIEGGAQPCQRILHGHIVFG